MTSSEEVDDRRRRRDVMSETRGSRSDTEYLIGSVDPSQCFGVWTLGPKHIQELTLS